MFETSKAIHKDSSPESIMNAFSYQNEILGPVEARAVERDHEIIMPPRDHFLELRNRLSVAMLITLFFLVIQLITPQISLATVNLIYRFNHQYDAYLLSHIYFVALPLTLYFSALPHLHQIYRYSSPGMYRNEKRVFDRIACLFLIAWGFIIPGIVAGLSILIAPINIISANNWLFMVLIPNRIFCLSFVLLIFLVTFLLYGRIKNALYEIELTIPKIQEIPLINVFLRNYVRGYLFIILILIILSIFVPLSILSGLILLIEMLGLFLAWGIDNSAINKSLQGLLRR